MLKIGDFSKLSRVSIRMLRHYDGIGLLHPVKTDKFTGYRYYSEEQLVIAGRITALKNMGFGLSVIGDIMTHCDDAEKLRTYLSLRKKELEAEAEDTAQKLRTLPPVTFASCTFKGSYELISEANAAVASWVEANGYEYAGPMFNIYHVSPHETSDPNEFVTEVCYPINKK